MKRSLYEQETIILYNQAEATAEDNGFLFIEGELHRLPPFCLSNSSLKLTYCPSSSSTTVAS